MIAEKGSARGSYISYQYLNRDQTLEMLAPETAGAYELRWVQGKTREILVTRSLIIAAVKITLVAPSSAQLGGDVEVSWSSTVNPRDFITIVEADAKERSYKSYIYTKTNTSGKLRAPEKPGQYEVRYLSGAKYFTLAKLPITVGGVDADITVPAEVAAGAPFEIVWTGHNNPGDYVTLVKAGTPERRWSSYEYVHQGPQLMFRAPFESDTYELRYLTG